MRLVKVIILSIIVVFLSTTWILVAYSNDITNFKTINGFEIKSRKITNYDSTKGLVDMAIVPSSNAKECGMLEGESKVDFKKIEDNTCNITTDAKSAVTVYFKDKKNNISAPFTIDNYVLELGIKEKYYLPLDTNIDILSNATYVGKPNIKVKSDSTNIEIIDNKIHTLSPGTNIVDIYLDEEKIGSTTIITTDVIIPRATEFNLKKEYISCKEYNGESAKLLDEILDYRVNEAGLATRAGVVEAARFLTLEFPRRIPYYWENGRLYKTGNHYVDGEGRYYHKGLYLDESKYNDIVASMQGPQMWGCKMINWQNDPPDFIRYNYYPNGLDCSGFVSWVLLNGGFDVGDKGAGPVGGNYDLTDLGDFKYLSDQMIYSGLIKPGDLFSTNGHISILVGIDDEHFYIAESLNHYGGVVMRIYHKNRIRGFFQHVVLMDNLYKQDGNLTNLWF